MSHVGRRQFLLASGALLAAPLVRARQPGRIYRVGVLFVGGSAATKLYRSALRDQLAVYGFVEGSNLKIDARGALGITREDRELARELVATGADAIFASGVRTTEAAQAETRSIPIVFTWVGDPVASGFVKTYRMPGGNVTGVSNRHGELLIKRLELALALVPKVKRVALLTTTLTMVTKAYEASAPAWREAAAKLGFELLEMTNVGTLNRSWSDAIVKSKSDGAEVILPYGSFSDELTTGEQIVHLTNRLGIPTIYSDANIVEMGGLISYGTDPMDEVRRGADLLARVLKGAKPAELPVDQAARFELVVNLKTARALRLTIPQSVIVRADRVIE